MNELRSTARRRGAPVARLGALLATLGLLLAFAWPAMTAGSQAAFNPSELDIDVVPSTAEANSGSQITWLITVTNEDTTAAGAFTIVNELPDETLFVSCAAGPGGTCGGAGNVRTISFPGLGSGSSATVQIVASVGCLPDDTDIFNTTEVISSTPRPDGEEVENETAYVTVRNTQSSGNLTGDILGPRAVAAGEHLCLTNARFEGTLTVNPGGGLTLVNSDISKGVVTNGAGFVRICGSRIAGFLAVGRSSGPVTVGDGSTGCPGSRITGGATLTGNQAGLVLSGNEVAQTASITGNTAGNTGSDIVVQANTVWQNLDCAGNTPAPVDAGMPNTVVRGAKTGQCTGL